MVHHCIGRFDLLSPIFFRTSVGEAVSVNYRDMEHLGQSCDVSMNKKVRRTLCLVNDQWSCRKLIGRGAVLASSVSDKPIIKHPYL